MIPAEVAQMANDMELAGVHKETALKLAWSFYNMMTEDDTYDPAEPRITSK